MTGLGRDELSINPQRGIFCDESTAFLAGPAKQLTMPDATTIGACSTACAALFCIAILLLWIKDGRPAQRSLLLAPFALAVPAGALLTYPEILPGPWGCRMGWFLLMVVFAATWQSARVAAGRKPQALLALAPCFLSLVIASTLASGDGAPELRMVSRTLLMAVFSGLAALEYRTIDDPQLPSARMLQSIFAAFSMFDFARLPFALFLPNPLGPEPTQLWSVIVFDMTIVLEGMLFGVFMTALGREQLAAKHYRLACLDPLTGVGNRRALDERIDAEARHGMASRRTAVGILDIDHFKAINDAHGHGFGDVVIVGAANVAREVLGTANVFRVGGEEFAVIIESSDEAAIIAKAERMRSRFADRCHVEGGVTRRCTISIGLAMLEPGANHDSMFRAADQALYLAKRLGRNRTIIADDQTLGRLRELDRAAQARQAFQIPPASFEETALTVAGA